MSRAPVKSRAATVGPSKPRKREEFVRALTARFIVVAAALVLVIVWATGLIPSPVVAFLAALICQAALWWFVRDRVRHAMATPSRELGPTLRFLETLRRYVADEDPSPTPSPRRQ